MCQKSEVLIQWQKDYIMHYFGNTSDTIQHILIGLSPSNWRIDTHRRDPDEESRNRKIVQKTMDSTNYKEYKPSGKE